VVRCFAPSGKKSARGDEKSSGLSVNRLLKRRSLKIRKPKEQLVCRKNVLWATVDKDVHDIGTSIVSVRPCL